MSKEIIEKIKNIKWDHRVTRTGYFQSKFIVVKAEMQPIELVGGIVAKYTNQLWVNDYNLYDERETESFSALFEKAFQKDPTWPKTILNALDAILRDKETFETHAKEWVSAPAPSELFKTYTSLLYAIQKYYVIAVPLTNYCEAVLRSKGIDPGPFAVPFKKLDVDFHLASLRAVQDEKDMLRKEDLIVKHLSRFAWIKTAYNIVESYTRENVDEELSKELPHTQLVHSLPEQHRYLFEALQMGIYLRNRMKELSQQLWFSFEPLVENYAKQFGISRDDFLSLLPDEVERSFLINRVDISLDILQARRKGFVVGFLDDNFVLYTDQTADELFQFFTPKSEETRELRGQIACKGIVQGTVRLVIVKADFSKFQRGEILVTSMTTPDFVILMKKAGAIVTDEGGLSSHAAIVSRELKVPCVIGTKIATKVLKDGDLVEVDANNGIVKIIK